MDISEEEQAARYWRRSKEHSRTLMAEKRLRRNLSRADHRAAYVAGYAPFEEIAPGLADLMYDEWKTNPLTMVPYPDTPAVLKAFAAAGLPIGIVSNTGWSINAGYAATGLDAFIQTFVLSCDLGIAKPDPEPFLTRLRAARRVSRTDAHGRQQPAGRLGLDLRRLPLPDPAAGTARRDPGPARRRRHGRHCLGRVAPGQRPAPPPAARAQRRGPALTRNSTSVEFNAR